MSGRFVELTRIDADPDGRMVIVGLHHAAWIEPRDDGATRIVFAVAAPAERTGGAPVAIVVRESIDEIARRAGLGQKPDPEAIVRAWEDQSARRRLDEERE